MLDEKLREALESCRESMVNEVVSMKECFLVALSKETQARKDLQVQDEDGLERIRVVQEDAIEKQARFSLDLRNEVDEIEGRLLEKLQEEVNWLQAEITTCRETVEVQASALKQACIDTESQFRTGSDRIRAASPSRSRPGTANDISRGLSPLPPLGAKY